MKHLEEIVATEGNTELQSFLTAGSVDWKTELERNRQLTSRTELQTKESDSHQSLYKDGAMAGSSYDFLKSILGSLQTRCHGCRQVLESLWRLVLPPVARETRRETNGIGAVGFEAEVS
ncbi:unnamed protein product [Arctogadus glacialis]